MPRISDTERLLYRTAERLSNLPFRTSGRIPASILSSVELFSTVPREASFAVSFRVGHSSQMTLPGATSLGEEMIDDLLECLEMFNEGAWAQLRLKIPQEEYYNNFVALARNIGPDGDDVKLVGFTANRRGTTKTVSLTGGTSGAATPAPESAAAATETPARTVRDTRVRGFLKEADSRDSTRGKIHIVDAEGASHTVIVPPGMMTDIVKPLWESEVEIVGTRKRTAIHLATIRLAKAPTKT